MFLKLYVKSTTLPFNKTLISNSDIHSHLWEKDKSSSVKMSLFPFGSKLLQ